MSVSVDDIKLIPKEEVPSKSKRTNWDQIFEAIPKGKAAVLSEEKIKPSAVRQALQRRHRRGSFTHLSVIITGNRGQRTIYVVNSEE